MPRPASPADETETVDPSGVTQSSERPSPLATRPEDARPLVVHEGPDPLVGKTLRHFRVDAPLGQGGMGAVYRAWDLSLDRPVALKVLLHDSPTARARFVREARAQAKLRHPNVVPIHYVDDGGSVAFFVMEVVEGESLAAVLDRGALAPDLALDLVDVVAQALDAGQAQGLVHRDVKPSNILIDRGGRILLADFGLAKDVHSHDPDVPHLDAPRLESGRPSGGGAITREGSIVGTPAYFSPEQAAGLPVDFRSDIYSLGVTLYEAVTGKPPFTAKTTLGLIEQHKGEDALPPRARVPTLSPTLDALVMRMIQKSPDRRFASYQELRAAIATAHTRRAFAAPPLPRAIALFIDVCIFGLVAAVATAVSAWIAWPLLGLVLGLVEGRWGRTPGKKWMRLCAVGPFDSRIGYPRSIARNELKLWGPTLATWIHLAHVSGFLSGLVMTGWTVDMILGALVGARRPLHDRLAGAKVVVGLEEANPPPLPPALPGGREPARARLGP
jgi:predicted Ser/Thr protein kinase